ncbi:MAG: hypothetical protein ACI9LM_005033 [Alteromonadaceae bacterium]|jgi:hypothetical protein
MNNQTETGLLFERSFDYLVNDFDGIPGALLLVIFIF